MSATRAMTSRWNARGTPVEKRLREALLEIERLSAIEAAARQWRASLEDDGWTEDDITESGPGMAELMRLLQAVTVSKELVVRPNAKIKKKKRGPGGVPWKRGVAQCPDCGQEPPGCLHPTCPSHS